jgi:PAS domain S-box-containing protein
MSPIAILDLIACGVSLSALGLLILKFKSLLLQGLSRYLLAGLLALMAAQFGSLFLEWSGWADQNLFDYIENFLGTLSPMAWFLVFFCLVKEVAATDLMKSEQKLRAFLDYHYQLTAMLDPQGRLILVNKATLELINAKADDVLGKLVWEVFWFEQCHPEQQKAIIDLFNSAKEGCFVRMELELQNAKGELRNFDISINPFFSQQKEIQWLVVEGRDITDLRKAQTLAKETLELSKTILFKIDLNHERFDYISPYIESLTGFAPSYFINGGLKWVIRQLHSDGQAKFANTLKKIASRTLEDGPDEEYELRFRGRDGTYNWYRARNTIRFDELGKAESIIGSLEKITEQKKAENVLHNYEQIVSHTGDLLALVDTRYVFLSASNSYHHYFGQSARQLIGQELAAIEGREHFIKITKPMADRCLGGEEVNYQTSMSTPNGNEVFLDINYYPYIDEETKRIAGFVVSARDITANKRLAEQLRQAQKMEAIGTLAGGIAHDFNNILSAILGFSELGITHTGDKEAIVKYMQEIHKAGLRAGDLVRQILTFSRQSQQEIKPLLLKPLIKEALKFIRASAPSTIEIRADLRSGGHVMVDPTQMHQIILNLSTNASYAMKDNGGVLSVALTDYTVEKTEAFHTSELGQGDYLKLVVSDTGIGIPGNIIDRIFDPFFTTKPKEEGTGMGLSVVHGIVESYGGAVSVQSTVGRGTTFSIFLPKITTVDATPDFADATDIPSGNERILIVDDEKPLVEITTKILRGLGYDITSTTNSIDALNLFKGDSTRFDLVITDLTMPNLTGDKLALHILKLRPDMPIIMTTGFSQGMSEGDIAKMGVRRIIHKPVIKKDIAIAIREVLDR